MAAALTIPSMVIVVIGWYFIKGPDPNRGEVVLARFGPNTLAAFPVQVFAFTCAQNVRLAWRDRQLTPQLFPIYNELKDRTQQKMNLVIGSSIYGAAAVYEVVSHVE